MSEHGPFSALTDHATRWLAVISASLATDDTGAAWTATRAVLQTLRDHLTHDEAAHLAAQLPLIFRGAFYEGWRPAQTPKRIRNADEFLIEIGRRLEPRPLGELGLVITFQAVVSGLARCGLADELAQAQRQLPLPVQELWHTAMR